MNHNAACMANFREYGNCNKWDYCFMPPDNYGLPTIPKITINCKCQCHADEKIDNDIIERKRQAREKAQIELFRTAFNYLKILGSEKLSDDELKELREFFKIKRPRSYEGCNLKIGDRVMIIRYPHENDIGRKLMIKSIEHIDDRWLIEPYYYPGWRIDVKSVVRIPEISQK